MKTKLTFFLFFFLIGSGLSSAFAQDCPFTINDVRDCSGASSGEYLVTFSATGGAAPYTFQEGNFTGILGEDEEGSFSVVDGSGYFLKAIDANGCTVEVDQSEITPCSKEEDCPTTYEVAHRRDCSPSGATGFFDVYLSASGGEAPYTVSGDFNGFLFSDGEEVSFPVQDGNGYAFTVVDANNCIIIVSETDLLPCSKTECPDTFTVTDERDCGPVGETGFYDVTLTVSGGVAPYTVSGSFQGILFEGESVTFSVQDGNGYTLTVNDSDKCEFFVDRSDVTPCSKDLCEETYVVNVERDCDPVSATGFFDVTVSASGGLAPYVVDGTLQDILDEGEVATFSVQDGGGYALFITDGNGCTIIVDRNGIEPCTKLAVEMLRFEGESVNDGNLLSWVTASETNNDYYTIYHSVDGENYDAVEEISGAGTSESATSYNYLHKGAANGTNYYYIAQTDFDGTVTESEVIVVVRGEKRFDVVRIFPTPANDIVNVVVSASNASIIDVMLYDITGKEMARQSYMGESGVNTVNMDISNLPEGLYFLKVFNEGEEASTMMIKD